MVRALLILSIQLTSTVLFGSGLVASDPLVPWDRPLGDLASLARAPLEIPLALSTGSLVPPPLLLTSSQQYVYSLDGMPEVLARKITYRVGPGRRYKAVLKNPKFARYSLPPDLDRFPLSYRWSAAGGKVAAVVGEHGVFPGTWLESQQIGSEVHATLYSAQVNWDQDEQWVLTSGEIVLESDNEPEAQADSSFDTLLITSESFKDSAQKIVSFHQEVLGLRTEVYTVEEIEEAEEGIEEQELPSGWKDTLLYPDRSAVENYPYLLSKKIIRFLHKQMHEGNRGKSVLLLGDATIVPPSYYHYLQGEGWGPTDQCYGSEQRCLLPHFSVGRLPFNDPEQVELYLQKAKAWVTRSEFSNDLSLYGGKGFQSLEFIGELSALTILSGESEWQGVEKYFLTSNTHQRSSILSFASGRSKSAFLYYLDHGLGDSLFADKQRVRVSDILEAAQGKSLEMALPIMATIACFSAAYDLELLSASEFERFTLDKFSQRISVGEALVNSSLGVTAFIGPTRVAAGSPHYRIDERGNLEFASQTYTLALFSEVFRRLSSQSLSLGEAIRLALEKYRLEYGRFLDTPLHRWTYLNFTLLGDPALPIALARAPKATGSLGKVVFPLQREFGQMIPTVDLEPSRWEPTLLRFSGETPAKASLYRIDRRNVNPPELIRTAQIDSSGELDLFEEDALLGRYLIRLENVQGTPRERRIWYDVRER